MSQRFRVSLATGCIDQHTNHFNSRLEFHEKKEQENESVA